MPTFNDYQFTQSQITAIVSDVANGQYVWVAYTQKDTFCLLQKVSAHNLSQVYYSISLPVSSINGLAIAGNNLFVAVNHSTIAAYIISISAPLSSQIQILKSTVSLTLSPFAVIASTDFAYFLTQTTGLYPQLVSFNKLGIYQHTYTLNQSGIIASNAVSLTVDNNENLWIIDNSNPTNLFRVWFGTGSTFYLQQTILS